jgi:hypothetical protein
LHNYVEWMQYDDKYIRKIDHRLTVSEYILVKPTLLTQIFQKCPRASVSQASNLCAKRANWHARCTLRTRLARQFPFARYRVDSEIRGVAYGWKDRTHCGFSWRLALLGAHYFSLGTFHWSHVFVIPSNLASHSYPPTLCAIL